MKLFFTSFNIHSPVSKHELSVIPTFKDMHFSSAWLVNTSQPLHLVLNQGSSEQG